MAKQGVKVGVQTVRRKADGAALKVLAALQGAGAVADLADELTPWLEVAGKARPGTIARLAVAARDAGMACDAARKAVTQLLERSADITPAELVLATGDDPRQEKLPGVGDRR